MAAGAAPAELWLYALQRLTAAVAHELRNPLNVVSLNLEVLRGRVSRAHSEVGSLTGFAEAAAAELGVAIRLTDALLAVARPLPAPVEVGGALVPIATLARAVAVAHGGSLAVTLPDGMPPKVASGADAVRGALAAVLFEAVQGGETVRCEAVYEPDAVVVEVAGENEFVLPDGLAASIEACGIAVQAVPHGIALRMPRHDAATR
ncbi:MAG TPA: histidine kinase dimerization/phospho-acceptor domain-containing protein [Gemmatimonadaceae bacterium]|nr:histidine kinase dimerization/phospho-acceptor domain-containing protein [Gemmatimonadaceae bacterium]